ncbi:MAG: SPOR domain-containing protein [Sulfuricurvum sp.]|nr:SPOR domain-containing protein [Sulfuricurvum sp.]
MIKKIVLIAAMGAMGVLWGSGDVTIQVINAVKEKSITHDFKKKLEKTGLSIHKVVEGGRYIVTLGSYKDHQSAQKALKKARAVVCAGAFIRPIKRDQVAVAPHESAKAVKAASVTSTHHETAKTETPAAAHAEVKAAVVAHSPVVVQEPNKVVVVEVKPVSVEVKNSPAVVAKTESQAASEKKEAYKSEIAQAINFYKNSPYHRFEPVKLQQ